ncbi:hypothetical protein G6011_03513 [Alternaria panax]|uniref:Cytochrome P450 n=1 Tax=Alternaria panax TaxID=48097 RepID=A0AAD4NSV3_9PLEO|nr:hypothetical protein G6011_03513 [Alternaria panax]
MIAANNSNHARICRALNRAFFEQALRSQESIITSYIKLLIKKPRQRADTQTPVDIGEVTDLELKHTCGTIILGGSETSATLLSGAICCLPKAPAWMEKLHQELAATFKSDNEISYTSLSQLKVLNAIIQDTFRIYSPVWTALPRIISLAGAKVCGDAPPPGTQVGISQYAMYHTSSHFTNPSVYATEHFLGAEQYAKDTLDAIQPFSVGRCNCIGQSLTWAETESILARLVWHFEFELLDPEQKWDNQKFFVLWQKPRLIVRLKVSDPGS